MSFHQSLTNCHLKVSNVDHKLDRLRSRYLLYISCNKTNKQTNNTIFSPFEEDIVVHEFATLCLASLSVDFFCKVQIFDNKGLPPVIQLLSSPDPDVKKNSLEIIFNLVQVTLSLLPRGGYKTVQLRFTKNHHCVLSKI